MKKLICVVLTLLLACVPVCQSVSATENNVTLITYEGSDVLRVPYASLAEADNAAEDDDIIEISGELTMTEGFVFTKKIALSLAEDATVTFTSDTAEDVRLFTIPADGYLIMASGSSITMTGTGSAPEPPDFTAIYSPGALLVGCADGNISIYNAGGSCIETVGDLTFNCDVSGNYALIAEEKDILSPQSVIRTGGVLTIIGRTSGTFELITGGSNALALDAYIGVTMMREMSGTINVAAFGSNARGIVSSGAVNISEITGDITAICYNSNAVGIESVTSGIYIGKISGRIAAYAYNTDAETAEYAQSEASCLLAEDVISGDIAAPESTPLVFTGDMQAVVGKAGAQTIYSNSTVYLNIGTNGSILARSSYSSDENSNLGGLATGISAQEINLTGLGKTAITAVSRNSDGNTVEHTDIVTATASPEDVAIYRVNLLLPSIAEVTTASAADNIGLLYSFRDALEELTPEMLYELVGTDYISHFAAVYEAALSIPATVVNGTWDTALTLDGASISVYPQIEGEQNGIIVTAEKDAFAPAMPLDNNLRIPLAGAGTASLQMSFALTDSTPVSYMISPVIVTLELPDVIDSEKPFTIAAYRDIDNFYAHLDYTYDSVSNTVTFGYVPGQALVLYNVDCAQSGHFGEWTVTLAPTCITDGTEEFDCALCGEHFTKNIPAMGAHVYDDAVQTPADCTHNAYTTQKCTCAGCTAEIVVEIPNTATGNHEYVWSYDPAPTCCEPGVEKGVCRICGAETETVVPPTENHTLSWSVEEAPTCCHLGRNVGRCTQPGCTYYDEEVIPATGEHVYGNWVTITPATCCEFGLEEGTCINEDCTASATRVIIPLGGEHDPSCPNYDPNPQTGNVDAGEHGSSGTQQNSSPLSFITDFLNKIIAFFRSLFGKG